MSCVSKNLNENSIKMHFLMNVPKKHQMFDFKYFKFAKMTAADEIGYHNRF